MSRKTSHGRRLDIGVGPEKVGTRLYFQVESVKEGEPSV
jgi:hypothetical protein